MTLAGAGPLVLVGAGRMGGAMLARWIEAGLDPASITIIDPGLPESGREALRAKGLNVLNDPANRGALAPPKVLVFAVKPQVMGNALMDYASLADSGTIVVSVAAGVRLAVLEHALSPGQPVIRVMPNTPCLVGAGMSVGFANQFATEKARDTVDQMMRATGNMAWIDDEDLMDAVTAVSGSGPAYVFHLAEALAEAGKAAGLPDALADMLARQTVIGGGALLADSEDQPATLRENVTSPAGTTAAALDVLMNADNNLMKLLNEAVAAARRRSIELG